MKEALERPQEAVLIAEALLDIGAVLLRPHQPFVWTSGLKSPIYCDNRLTMSFPEVRELVAQGFVRLMERHFADAEVIAGTATAGIPHAAWVAQKLGLPMIYVRDKAKGHGRENLIEGVLPAGKKVVVIEDLISTGGSSLKAAQAVAAAGGEVLGVAAIFSYQFKRAEQLFASAGIPLVTISNYLTLLDCAVQRGAVAANDLAMLQAWKADPSSYGN